MTKKIYLSLLALYLLLFSCNVYENTEDEQVIDEELNVNIKKMISFYEQAQFSNSKEDINEFKNFLKDFDSEYNSTLYEDFIMEKSVLDEKIKSSASNENVSPIDIPINTDGAIYLSGGVSGTLSSILTFVSPLSTHAGYYHGAVLDLDRYTPEDPDSKCFQTALFKGADYETPSDWMQKVNVAILVPKEKISSSQLNNAQSKIDYFCRSNNKNMKYGFFKNYINISSITNKFDDYYWYCTKVVWRVFDLLGLNIDSDSDKIDWNDSGLAKMIRAYYNYMYFYNRSKAQDKYESYLSHTKKTLVLAEEIYFSKDLVKVYENIRD